MDNYDYYDKNQGDAPKKSSRLATTTTTILTNGGETSGRAAAGARKPLTGSAPGSDDSKIAALQVHAGASSNGHVPAAAPPSSSAAASRKRKAVNAPAQVAVATTTSGQSARRAAASNTAQSSTSAIWRETNMLSFENCEGRPQNGRLVADDGTVLEANGKSWWLHPCAISQHHGGVRSHCTAPPRQMRAKTNRFYQIMSTWCASRPASLTTSVASWSSCTCKTTRRGRWTRCASTGSTARRISGAR